MQNPLSTVALLAMGVAFQCGADVPAQPQHNAQNMSAKIAALSGFTVLCLLPLAY